MRMESIVSVTEGICLGMIPTEVRAKNRCRIGHFNYRCRRRL